MVLRNCVLFATDVGIEDDNLVAVMFEQFLSLSLILMGLIAI